MNGNALANVKCNALRYDKTISNVSWNVIADMICNALRCVNASVTCNANMVCNMKYEAM